MSKTGSQDNFVAYIAAAVVIGLVGVFVLTWNHLKSPTVSTGIAYAKFGPYRVETQTFALSATLVVQTDTGDADWPNRHKDALNVIFRKVLADTDAGTIKSPNRMQLLQDALTRASNTGLNTKVVQSVLLTDFTFEEHVP